MDIGFDFWVRSQTLMDCTAQKGIAIFLSCILTVTLMALEVQIIIGYGLQDQFFGDLMKRIG